jgi:hypothetical protein
MADELKDRGPRDRAQINVTGDWEVRWWCKELGCTTTQLVNAIKSVGPTADKVRAYLKKPKARNSDGTPDRLRRGTVKAGASRSGRRPNRNGTL